MVQRHILIIFIINILFFLPGFSRVALAVGITLPVYENDIFLGEVSAVIKGQGVQAVDGRRFNEIIESYVSDATLDKLQSLQDEMGMNTISALKDEGIIVELDFQELVLNVQLGAELRRERTIALREDRLPNEKGHYTAESFSTYINMFATQDYLHRGDVGTKGRQPFELTLEGAAHVGGFTGVTLEGEGFYNENEDRAWRRGDVRLIHDDVMSAMRYAAGDINFTNSGFQDTTPLGGFSVARYYNELQPFRLVSPGGQRSFILERRSKVDVYINGSLTRTLNLNPGKINLQDFPFIDGINDVRLEVEDDAGRVETIEFSTFFDNDLLEKGLSEFSYNVGFPSEVVDNRIRYNEDLPSLSLFHNIGITDTLTLGVNAQGNKEVQQAGAVAVLATSGGNFGVEASLSRLEEDNATSGAVKLDWEYDLAPENNQELDLSIDVVGDDFASLSTIQPNNPFSIDAQMRFRTDLPWNFGASFTARRAWGRDTQGNINSVGGTVNRLFGTASTYLSLDFIDEQNEDDEIRTMFSISWRLGRRQSVSSRYNSTNSRISTQWTRFQRNVARDWGANVSLERTDDNAELEGQFDYSGNRFEATYEHELLSNDLNMNLTQRRSRLRFASAIGFADGHIAVGRPVDNSFAIFYPHKSLDDIDLAIDVNREGKARAWVDALGSALVHDVDNYRAEDIEIGSQNLPVGYDLGEESYNVLTSYGSGVAVQVGSDASVIAIGTGIDREGVAVPYASGFIVAEGADETQKIVIFTNRAGRFVAQGIKPGVYNIQLRDDNMQIYTGSFLIEDDRIGYVNLGDVYLNKRL